MTFPIKPIKLSEAEKVQLEEKMAIAHKCFRYAANTLYGSYSNKSILRLRNEWRNDPAILQEMPLANAKMQEMKELEALVFAVYVRCIVDIVWKRKKQDDDDLLNEGMVRLWNCMYLYNGDTRFSSFLYISVHRLFTNIYKHFRKKKRFEVVQSLQSLCCDFETRDPFDRKEWDEYLKKLMHDAHLNKRERETVESYLSGGKYQDLAVTWNCSRANVGTYFIRAKKKLRTRLVA
jgi:RNA polymerase sigma factor (sigma-70 family)